VANYVVSNFETLIIPNEGYLWLPVSTVRSYSWACKNFANSTAPHFGADCELLNISRPFQSLSRQLHQTRYPERVKERRVRFRSMHQHNSIAGAGVGPKIYIPQSRQRKHCPPSGKACSDIHVSLSLAHMGSSSIHPSLPSLYRHRIDMDIEVPRERPYVRQDP
jgi:hypothetical protein